MLSLKKPLIESPSWADAFTALLMSPLMESAGRCSIRDAFSPVPRFVIAVFRYPHSADTAYGSAFSSWLSSASSLPEGLEAGPASYAHQAQVILVTDDRRNGFVPAEHQRPVFFY